MSSFDEAAGRDNEEGGHQSNEEVEMSGNNHEQGEQEANVSNQARQYFSTLTEGNSAIIPDTLKLISRAQQDVQADLY
jgi:hypothetical protein